MGEYHLQRHPRPFHAGFYYVIHLLEMHKKKEFLRFSLSRIPAILYCLMDLPIGGPRTALSSSGQSLNPPRGL